MCTFECSHALSQIIRSSAPDLNSSRSRALPESGFQDGLSLRKGPSPWPAIRLALSAAFLRLKARLHAIRELYQRQHMLLFS